MNYSNQLLTLDGIQSSAPDLQQTLNTELLNKQQRHDLLVRVLKSTAYKPSFIDLLKSILISNKEWHITKIKGPRGVTFL